MTNLISLVFILAPIAIIIFFIFMISRSGPTLSQKVVVAFVTKNLETTTASDFFNQSSLKTFSAQITERNDIAAAKTYSQAMDAPLAEARLAVAIAKQLP